MSGPDREARVARGHGPRIADFARGRGSRGAGRRPPATLPTLTKCVEKMDGGTAAAAMWQRRRRRSQSS